MIGQREMKMDDYWAILRRRRWVILVPAIIGPILAVAVTFFLHEEFKSTTLVLVEDQKVPDTIAHSVVTDDLNVRLSSMQEQILSRTRLQPIIEKFGLFKSEQNKLPMEDLVDKLRTAIEVTPVRAMSGTRPGGLPGFYINVTLDNARTAQNVCSEITSMFTAQNLKDRETDANSTTSFLQSRVDDAQRDLNDKDAKLATFKAQHAGELPTDSEQNINLLNSLNTQLDGVNQAISRAQTEKTLFNSMLTQALATEQSSGKNTDPDVLQKQMEDLKKSLSIAQAKYTDDHPDVKSLKAQIADLQKRIDAGETVSIDKPKDKATTDKDGKTASKPVLPETPQVQQLRQQIFLSDQTIKEKSKQQTELLGKIRTYEGRIQMIPAVEEQFKVLTRDYNTSVENYNELLKKLNDAQMSKGLEARQLGETFDVMDPANLPEKPSFPKRWAFAGGGLAAGLIFGLGFALILEMGDKAIRTDRDVETLLGLRTLAMVPIVNEESNGTGKISGPVKIKKRPKPQQQPVGA